MNKASHESHNLKYDEQTSSGLNIRASSYHTEVVKIEDDQTQTHQTSNGVDCDLEYSHLEVYDHIFQE